MKRTQIQILNEAGLTYLTKAQACADVRDVKELTILGQSCLAQAREILNEIAQNSVLAFIECCAHLGKAGTSYPSYILFCTRNKLEILSEIDFQSISEQILGSLDDDAALAQVVEPSQKKRALNSV